nr:metal-dependent phosphohydrolase [Nonomuraea sp. FMUSA5-5]
MPASGVARAQGGALPHDRTWGGFGAGWVAVAGGSAAALALGAELVARWAEPHRRYHTRTHLAAVLAAIDDLADEAADLAAVRLAAWFHDAVYDGRPGWDEERSAQLAQARLPACGVPAQRVAEVARLVRLTAAHDTLRPGDRNGAVLCDADLAILAAPPSGDRMPTTGRTSDDSMRAIGPVSGDFTPATALTYDGYARAIRQEYAHVPDVAFAEGRSAVLRRLLAAPALYRTPRARALWEERARANMTGELARLRAALAAAQPGGDETA